jgi:hypothetical protein
MVEPALGTPQPSGVKTCEGDRYSLEERGYVPCANLATTDRLAFSYEYADVTEESSTNRHQTVVALVPKPLCASCAARWDAMVL